jgi:hypothetical protein
MKYLLSALLFFCATGAALAQLPATLPSPDSLSDQAVAALCSELGARARSIVAFYDDDLASTISKRQETESKIAAADPSDKEAVKNWKKEVKSLLNVEKKTLTQKKMAVQLSSDLADIGQADATGQRAALPALWNRWQKLDSVVNGTIGNEAGVQERKKVLKPSKKKKEEVEKPISEVIADSERKMNEEDGADTPKKASKKKKKETTETTPETETATSDTEATTKKVPRKKKKATAETTPETETATSDTEVTTKKASKKKKKETVETPPETDLVSGEAGATEDTPEKKKKKGKKTDEVLPAADSIPSTSGVSGKKTAASTKKFKSYNPLNDVLLNPSMPVCSLTLNTRDEFSGDVRRATAREELFKHTNPLAKNYLQGKTQVVCDAAMSRTGGQVFLSLYLIINDPATRKAQGILPQNAQVILKFIDGSTYSIYNQQSDNGRSDAEGQSFLFEGRFLLDRDVQKKIKGQELDKMRIHWANGYDDYEVYDIRLLMRQQLAMDN